MRLIYRRSRFYLSIGYLFDLGMAIIFLAALFCLSCNVHIAIRVKKGVGGGSLPALKMLVIEKCDLLLLEKQSYSKLIRNNNNYF